MGVEDFASGVEDFSVRFPGTNYIYVIVTFYWVSNDMTNTFFLGAMRFFSVLNTTLVGTLGY